MTKNISEIMGNHFVKNMALYIIITLSFTIGICTGAFTINTLDPAQHSELKVYLQDFFHIIANENIDQIALLKISVIENIKTIFLLWFFGVTIIGIPFILIIIGIKGFIIGFTVGFFIHAFNSQGVLFSLVAIIPQNLIMIPCYIFLGIICINFSLRGLMGGSKLKHKYDSPRPQILSYSILVFVILCIVMIGSILEAYVSPVFIKSVALMFI